MPVSTLPSADDPRRPFPDRRETISGSSQNLVAAATSVASLLTVEDPLGTQSRSWLQHEAERAQISAAPPHRIVRANVTTCTSQAPALRNAAAAADAVAP